MPMQQQMLPGIPKIAHAILSEDRKYRYVLYRSLDGLAWDSIGPGRPRRTVCFVLLNPSVADEYQTDPTIDKLIKYGSAWGFQRLAVVNVYALIETDSRKLKLLRAIGADLAGPLNAAYLAQAMNEADRVVCGWGNEGFLGERAALGILRDRSIPALCFGTNINGTPVHPLYQRDAAGLIPYEHKP